MTREQRAEFITRWCDEHPLFNHKGAATRTGATMENCFRDLYKYGLELKRGQTGCPKDGRLM